jgi:hypothetical protein
MRYKCNNSFGDIVAGGNEQVTTKTKLFSLHAVYCELIIAHWLLVVILEHLCITSTLLYRSTDVMLDPIGNMYAADRSNHRIQFYLSGQSNSTTMACIARKNRNSSTQRWNRYRSGFQTGRSGSV